MPYIVRSLGETYLGRKDSAEDALRDAGSRITVRGTPCDVVEVTVVGTHEKLKSTEAIVQMDDGRRQWPLDTIACWAGFPG